MHLLFKWFHTLDLDITDGIDGLPILLRRVTLRFGSWACTLITYTTVYDFCYFQVQKTKYMTIFARIFVVSPKHRI